MSDLDLPFEEKPPGQIVEIGDLLGDGVLAGGVTITAAMLPVDGHGIMPALIYRFANPDGSGFYPATALIMSDEQMAGLKLLTAQAANAAVRAAKAARAAAS
jgi:hypothetical protein